MWVDSGSLRLMHRKPYFGETAETRHINEEGKQGGRKMEHFLNHSMSERLWLWYIIYKWINTSFALYRFSLTPSHHILYSFSWRLSLQNNFKTSSIDTCCFRNYVRSILTNCEALIWLSTKDAVRIPEPSHYCQTNLYGVSIISLFIQKLIFGHVKLLKVVNKVVARNRQI